MRGSGGVLGVLGDVQRVKKQELCRVYFGNFRYVEGDIKDGNKNQYSMVVMQGQSFWLYCCFFDIKFVVRVFKVFQLCCF